MIQANDSMVTKNGIKIIGVPDGMNGVSTRYLWVIIPWIYAPNSKVND
jgi:hypothetical protein